MSENAPETNPELLDPVGANGSALMGITPPAGPVEPAVPLTPAGLRAEAERLLAQADQLENDHGGQGM